MAINDPIPAIASFGVPGPITVEPVLDALVAVGGLLRESQAMVQADLQSQLAIAARCTSNCQEQIKAWLDAELQKVRRVYANCTECISSYLAKQADYAGQLATAAGIYPSPPALITTNPPIINIRPVLPGGDNSGGIIPITTGESCPGYRYDKGSRWYPANTGISGNLYGGYVELLGSQGCDYSNPGIQTRPAPTGYLWSIGCGGIWSLLPCPTPPPPPPPGICIPPSPCAAGSHWDYVLCRCVPDIPPPPPPNGDGGIIPSPLTCCLTKDDVLEIVAALIKGMKECFCPQSLDAELPPLSGKPPPIEYKIPQPWG